MIPLLLLSALSVQIPTSRADLHAVMRVVVAEVVPPGGNTGGRPNAERPVFIGVQQTLGAVHAIFPGASLPVGELASDRKAQQREQADAVVCSFKVIVGVEPPPKSCEVLDDGIFISVLHAAEDKATGEIMLFVRALWTGPMGSSAKRTLGYDMEMFFAKSDGAWRIARKGRAVAR